MNEYRGILLAGGAGTRLDPVTRVVSKQLLPVYDKPMVYYPLSVLMLAGIREVLVISTPRDLPQFRELLGTGEQLGMRLEYQVQERPAGIAQALTLGRAFLDGHPSALILGDNIFFGQGLQPIVQDAARHRDGATIFAYPVSDPRRYGVVELDRQGNPVQLIEKPERPRSRLAITGLYFYDRQAPEFAEQLTPSARGELEITDLNRRYLELGKLRVRRFGRGFAWLDTGTTHSLLQAANFVETLQERQGLRVACLEEVAYRMGFIDHRQLRQLSEPMNNDYGDYLRGLLEDQG